jgi:FO synthase
MHVHGFTALEVTEGAKRLNEPLYEYITRLKEAGLASLPGTAAEILDDDVRAILCPDKINTEEWLECHQVAHEAGLRSNITIMFGSVEQPHSWAKHIVRTRALQEITGGFTEFVGLPFVHMAYLPATQIAPRANIPRDAANACNRTYCIPRLN